jgi:uncharacterized protein YecT (DUF1311 family)
VLSGGRAGRYYREEDEESMMKLTPMLVLSVFFAAAPQSAHKQSDKIEEADLRQYLAKQNDCQPEQIYFSVLEQVDLLKKRYDQAVVVAGTCMTGTAGPDVHSVYTRDEEGEIKQLAIEEVKLPHRVLFGKSYSTFRIGDGILVEVYGDTSDREDPLIVKYRWNANAKRFEIIATEAARPFSTSYDCGKAEKDGDETALAICYVEPLANLDIQLATVYQASLSVLTTQERKTAIAEQRAWLEDRNKSCGIYKWWVECLEDAYKKRIAELEAPLEQRKKQTIRPPVCSR